MIEVDDELIQDFVVESREGMSEIESDLLQIEAHGANIDLNLVNKVFRTIHSIKGASGFLALERIGELSHSAENVLSKVRDKALVPTPAVVDQLLRAADLLGRMIEDIARSNDYDVSENVRVLKQIYSGEFVAAAETVAAVCDETASADATSAVVTAMVTPPEEWLGECTITVSSDVIADRTGAGENVLYAIFDLLHDREGKNPKELIQRLRDIGTLLDCCIDYGTVDGGEMTCLPLHAAVSTVLGPEQFCEFFNIPEERVSRMEASEADAPVAASDLATQEPVPAPMVAAIAAGPAVAEPAAMAAPTVSTLKATVPAVAAAPAVRATEPVAKAPAEANDDAHGEKKGIAADANIRVSVSVLDRLMNLAGELVLGRNQLIQTIATKDPRALERVANRIDQVTSELQETIMQTRMQPIGNVFGKFTRVVRDLSKTLGKQCQLEIEGKDVELDKTIVEAISDPMTHLIRNSMDHGLELPDVRSAKGKNPAGTIRLKASHQEGKVLIVVSDDGAGIDPGRIRRKAVEKGLITAETAAVISDRDAIQLIFAPGFSTVEQVTAVSGRGVGMDVVKTNFEKLGGSVEIETEVGQGTTILVRLPLTLAIIPSLIASVGGQRFAIPQVSISEMVRVRPQERDEKLGRVNKAEVLRLRGALLPLVRLAELLCIEAAVDETGVTNIVVVEAGRQRYGLIVDCLHDSEEIVVKPLGRHLKAINFLAGATVLGDGRIAMILDISGVANTAQLGSVEDLSRQGKFADDDEVGRELIPTLLFSNHPLEWFGIPMSVVARIERIRSDQIDTVAGHEVLQYRGGTLTLVSLEHTIKARPRSDQQRLYVVVFRHGGREFGLVAPEVHDIRSLPTEIDTQTFVEKGVLGSSVMDGHTVRFLDVFDLGNSKHSVGSSGLASTSERLSAVAPADGTAPAARSQPVVLFAEDSSFFRSRVRKFLEQEGWAVITAEDGQEAWEKLSDHELHVDLLLTDIEMPRMNGFELCEQVRASERWSKLPVIAVTSLAGDADRAHGISVGVTEYMVKLDRDQLVATVARVLGTHYAHQ